MLFFDYFSGGHDRIKLFKSRVNISAGITKSMLKDKLKVSFYCMDILHSDKDEYSMTIPDIQMDNKSFNGMSRGLSLSISYSFNSKDRRSATSGAGASEKKRL